MENAGGWFGSTTILKENNTSGFIPSLRVSEIVNGPKFYNVGFIVKVNPEQVTNVGRPVFERMTVSESTSVVAGNV